jgi:hypothetical protein
MKFRKEEKEKTLTKIGRVKAPLSPGRLVGESSEFRIAQALFINLLRSTPLLGTSTLRQRNRGKQRHAIQGILGDMHRQHIMVESGANEQSFLHVQKYQHFNLEK